MLIDETDAASRAGAYVGITFAALCWVAIAGLCIFPMLR